MADITKENVERVAHLARIGINNEEAEQFRLELAKIIEFIEELKGVDTEGVVPVGHVTGMENASRADKEDEPLPAEDHDLLEEQAPGHIDGEIRVPKILP